MDSIQVAGALDRMEFTLHMLKTWLAGEPHITSMGQGILADDIRRLESEIEYLRSLATTVVEAIEAVA